MAAKDYFVNINGDASKLIAELKKVESITKAELNKELGQLVIGIDYAASKDNIEAAFTQIKKSIPDLELKMRYDQAVYKGQLAANGLNLQERNQKFYDENIKDIDVSTKAGKEAGEAVRLVAEQKINEYLADIADEASKVTPGSVEFEKLIQKIQALFDFNAMLKKSDKADFRVFKNQNDLYKRLPNITGLPRSFIGTSARPTTDVSQALMIDWASKKRQFGKELRDRGYDPDAAKTFEMLASNINEATNAASKNADASRESAKASSEAKNSAEQAGDAAKQSGESAKESGKSFEESAESMKKFTSAIDANSIKQMIDALRELVQIMKEVTTVTFRGASNGTLERTLSNISLQKSAQDQKKLIGEQLLLEDDGSYKKNNSYAIYKIGKDLSKEIGTDSSDYYKTWAEKTAAYMQQAGYSIDKFIEKRRTLNLGEQLKVGSSIDQSQISQITGAINGLGEVMVKLNSNAKSLDSFKEFFDSMKDSGAFSINTEGLQDFYNALLELSDVIQRATGILSTSNLDKEFEKIKASAESLGNGSLASGKNRYGALQEVVDKFNKYKQSGGNRDLTEITNNQLLADKLQIVAEKTRLAAEEQEKLADKEREAANSANSQNIKSVIDAMDKISASKADEKLQMMASSLQAMGPYLYASSQFNALTSMFSEEVYKNIEKITNAITELVEAFKRVNGDAALNLDELFSSIKKQAQSSGLNNRKNFQGQYASMADDLYKRYRYYQERGGTEKLNYKGLNDYWNTYTTEKKTALSGFDETQRFKDIASAARDAAAGKEEFNKANERVRSSIDQSITKLDEGINKFNDLKKAAEDAGLAVKNSGIDFTKAFDVNQIKACAQALQAYANILKGTNASILKNTSAAEIKRNNLSQADIKSFGDLKTFINSDLALSQQYGARLANLDTMFANFQPGISKIDDLRKALADLKADAESTANALKKQTANINNSVKGLKTGFKDISKIIANPLDPSQRGANRYSKSQNLTIDEFKKEYDDFIQKFNGTDEAGILNKAIVDKLSEAQTLAVKMDEALANTKGQFTQDYLNNLEESRNEIKKIINALNDPNFDPTKLWDSKTLVDYLETLEKVNAEYSKSKQKENQNASLKMAQGLLARAEQDINQVGNNDELRGKYEDIINELSLAIDKAQRLNKEFVDIDRTHMDTINGNLRQMSGGLQRGSSEAKSFSNVLSSTITSSLASVVAQFMSIRDLWRYGKQIAQTVISVDSALTELRKVSEVSNIRLQESFQKSAETAQELGATITDVINSTADWARLGYSIDQSEELARITQLYQTVGDNMTQESASQSLISTIKGFQLDASEAESIVDKFNEVANNYAIDTAGIGDALQRSAAAFNASHTNLDKSIALVTATNSVLQNPEAVGTLWNTMSARLRGAETELADLNEETDEYTQSISKLQAKVKQMTGFDIMESDGQTYKDLYDIMVGIGKQWDRLSDVDQASLAEALAGKRNSKGLFAVLSNLEDLQEAYASSVGAAGSAMREQANYAQSVQYSLDRAKATIQEISTDFLSSGFLKGLLETGNSILQIITEIVRTLGSTGSLATTFIGIDVLKSVLTKGGRGILGNLLTAWAQSAGVSTDGKALGEIFKGILAESGAAAGQSGGLAAAKGVLLSFKGALEAGSVAAWGGLLVGIGAVAAVGISIWKQWQQGLVDDAKAAANEWSTKQSSLEKDFKDVQDLRKQLIDSNTTESEQIEIKKQIYEIQKNITSEYGEAASRLDLINGKLSDQRNILNDVSQKQAAANLVAYSSEYETAMKRATSRKNGTAAIAGINDPRLRKEFSEIFDSLGSESSLKYRSDETGLFQVLFGGSAKQISEDTDLVISKLQALRSEYEDNMREQMLAHPGSADMYKENYSASIKSIDSFISKISSGTKTIRDGYKEVEDTYKSYLQQQFFASGGGGIAIEAQKLSEEIQNAIITGETNGIDKKIGDLDSKIAEIRNKAAKAGWSTEDIEYYVDSVKSGLDEAAISAYKFKELLTGDTTAYDAELKAADENAKNAKAAYEKDVAEFEKLGVDKSRHEFGNIDLNNRNRLEWTQENIDKYRSALESWELDGEEYISIAREQGSKAADAWLDAYVDGMKGSYSTVFAGSNAFGADILPDGGEIEIAYTPLLRSENGDLSMLDKDSFDKYIDELLKRAVSDGQWTDEEIFQLDAEGIEINGKKIKGIIADVGDTAIATAEAMHYLGKDGSNQLYFREYQKNAEEYKRLVKESPYTEDEKRVLRWRDEVKDATFDVVDVQQMLQNKTNSFIGKNAAAQSSLQDLAESYGVFTEEGVADASALDSFIATLVELGIVMDSTGEYTRNTSAEFNSFKKSIGSTLSALDSVNAALASAAGGKGLSLSVNEETGALEGDLITIKNAFADLEGFNPADLFRKTANGVKLNEKQLRKLKSQQDKITRSKFLKQQQDLTKKLTEANKQLAAAQNANDRKNAKDQIDDIRKQLSELDYLKTAYEGATSAYQKWLDAQSAGERGDIYDNITKTAVSRADELYKAGLVGTNEFRALAELISGQDLSTASIDNVIAAYQRLDATIPNTSFKLRDLFTEGQEGCNAFATALVKTSHASEENGTIIIDSLDTEQLAEEWGTSVDFIEALLEKMNDYGAELKWVTREQKEQLDEVNQKYAEVKKNLESTDIGKKIKLSDFDITQLETVEELDAAALELQKILDDPMLFNIDDSQAQELRKLLDLILEKRNILENPTGTGAVTVDQFRQYQSAIDKLKGSIEDINKSDGLLELSDEDKQNLEVLAKLPPEIQTLLNLTPTKDTENLLKQLGLEENGDKSSGKSQAEVKLGAARIKPQRTENKRRESVERRETTLVGVEAAQSAIPDQVLAAQKIITDLPENKTTKITVEANADSEVYEVQTILGEFEGTPDEIAKQILLEALGEEEVKALQEAEDGVYDRKVQVIAKAIGSNDVNLLRNAINQVTGRTVGVGINVTGLSQIDTAVRKLQELANTGVRVASKTINIRTTQANGTAHAQGTARVRGHGNWGLKRDENALINEVGPELVVRGSNWFIPNNGRPTMGYPLKKDDIIFNSRQTEELLKNGYIQHGYAKMARAQGTVGGPAHASVSGRWKYYDTKFTTAKTKSSTTKTSSSGNGGNSTSAKSEIEKEIKDWIEVLLSRVARLFDNFKDMGDYWVTYANQIKELNSAIDQAKKNITYNQQAYWRYMQEANDVGLAESYAKKVRNGTIDIEMISNENLKEQIQQYTEWYEKALACSDTIRELNKEILDLSRQKLDDILDDFQSMNDYAQQAYDLASSMNDLYEKNTGVKSIEQLVEMAARQNEIISDNTKAYRVFKEEMEKQLANGEMAAGSQELKQAQTDLLKLQDEMVQAEIELKNINELIREVNWSNWKEAVAILEHMNKQIDSTVDLIGDLTVFRDNASITEAGITQLDLYASAMGNSRRKVEDYNNAIATLDIELAKGVINQKQYNEEMRDYREQQMAAVGEVKKYRDAVISLVKEGINAETEAMSKLIDKRKEDLKKQKEARDWAKTVNDKTTEINSIRAQIAALSGDTTMAAQARAAKLRADLQKKEDELREQRLDHEYEVVTQTYDEELEKFKEIQDATTKALEYSLANQENAIQSSLDFATQQYETTYEQLDQITQVFGINLEEYITNPWLNATAAVQTYKDAISDVTTTEERLSETNRANGPVNAEGEAEILTDKYVDKVVEEVKDYVETIKAPSVGSDGSSSSSSSTSSSSSSSSSTSTTTTKPATTTTTTTSTAKKYNFSGATLSRGSSGNDVKLLQQALNALMGAGLAVDGAYGAKTEAAVKAFQKKYGIGQDGIAGKITLGKINEVAGGKASTTTSSSTSNSKLKVSTNGGNLNLRDAPNGTIKSKAANGTTLETDGKTNGGWTHVKYNGAWYWAYTQYLKKAAKGALNARGLYLTDEEGIGSEAIITKEGVLRQLDSDTVFSKAQTEALWNLSKMNLDQVLRNIAPRGGQSVNLNYGSLLTVNGNVDKDALPGLKEILKQACDYTKRDMSETFRKMGLRGVF